MNALAASKTPGKEKPPCHNFAKGTCTFGDKCRYSQTKPPPPPPANTAIVPPLPKYNQGNNNRNTVRTYISPRHRLIVGPSNPQGDPKNPLGLTRNQRVKLNALTADESMDSRIDQSHYNHVPRDSNGNVFAGLLLPEPSSSVAQLSASPSAPVHDASMHTPEPYIDTFRTLEYLSDMTTATYNLHEPTPGYGRRQPGPVAHAESVQSTSSSSDDDEAYAAMFMNQMTHMADHQTYSHHISSYVELVVSRYHRQDHHPEYNEDTSLSNYLVTTHFNSLAGRERTDLQILGWSVSYPLHVYNIQSDFRTGSPALLDLLQNIGRSYIRTQDDDKSTDTCTGCGRTGHLRLTCKFSAAKHFNNGNGKYGNSTAYALLLKDRPNHKDKTCPRDTVHKPGNKSVSATTTSSSSDTASASQIKEPFKKKSKSSVSFIVSDTTVVLPKPITEPNLKFIHVSLVSD